MGHGLLTPSYILSVIVKLKPPKLLNFLHGQARENRSASLERAPFKLLNLPSFKCLKLTKIYLLKDAKFYRPLYCGGTNLPQPPPPPHTTPPPTTNTTIPASIIFSSFAELYLCSFYTYHSQTWQVHLFPDVFFFPVVAHVKS